jgi:hypothetical protein
MTRRITVSTYRVASTAILLCFVLPLGLCAQVQDDKGPCDAKILTPVPPRRNCPETGGPPPKLPGNIAEGTKLALECEWVRPAGVDPVLNTFKLLTSSSQPPDISRRVLDELKQGADGIDQDFYAAAMGNPDAAGPTLPALPNFLDMLAKANRPGDPDADPDQRKMALFQCTKDRIERIFSAECKTANIESCVTGPIALARINTSFRQKNNYLALYQLLNAAWQQRDQFHLDQFYLEKIRAAFEADADGLAKQVAAKIAAPAK